MKEFTDSLANEDSLIFNGTEQCTQRPSDDEAQKDNYSEKKQSYGKIGYFEQFPTKHLVCERVLGREDA